MFESVRRRAPMAIAVLMAVSLTGQAALAQSGDGVQPSAVSNINANKVDGKSAVGSTSNLTNRSGRLMAFAASGYLPNNIIQQAMDSALLDGMDSSLFATLAALRSATGVINEADNLVNWNQLFNVPATIADGVDAGAGYVSSIQSTNIIPATSSQFLVIDAPVGVDVRPTFLPLAAATWITIGDYVAMRTSATTMKYWYFVTNTFAVPVTYRVRILVFDQGIAPAALKKVAKGINVTVSKKGPRQ